MRTLMDRISYWWEERTAVLEDETMDRVVPPSDTAFERLSAWYAAAQERTRNIPWMRGRSGEG